MRERTFSLFIFRLLMKKTFFFPLLFIVLTIFIVSCATSKRMNRISVGMTKQEVFSVMGSPSSTASPGDGVEIFRYHLFPKGGHDLYRVTRVYFVRMLDGKVESYGEIGDFDSTKDPALDLNIKSE